MEPIDVRIDFQGDSSELTEELRSKAESRIDKLVRGHRDIVGVTIYLSIDSGDSQPRDYRARVSISRRGGPITSVGRDSSALAAVSDALDSVERQIRTLRDKRRSMKRNP